MMMVVFPCEGKNFKFKNIDVIEDKVRLYPDMTADEIINMITILNGAVKEGGNLSDLLEIQIKGLLSIGPTGEVLRLDEQRQQQYHQFREFFVQQIKPNTIPPKDSLFMDKNKPIFKEQPIARPDNFDQYWMNTPLKKTN